MQAQTKNPQKDLSQMKSEVKQECKKQQSRSMKNWAKVRNLMKKLKNNEFVSTTSKTEQRQRKFKLNILVKQQRQLSEEQKQFRVQKCLLNKNIQKYQINLLKCSQIIETISNIEVNSSQLDQIRLKTFRPAPKIQYLTQQQVGVKKIDTTGVWLWEAEEILAYYIVKNWPKYYRQRPCQRVLQIGAGCSGLAALAYSKLWQNSIKQSESDQHLTTIITDGKEDNIMFLQTNIEQNFQKPIHKQSIQAVHYLWGTHKPQINQQNQFDLILAADCLFFEQYHHELISSLNSVLKADGTAIFVNPRRGKSFANFLVRIDQSNSQKSYNRLQYKFISFNDEKYLKHLGRRQINPTYNSEEDQFIFLQITKTSPQETQSIFLKSTEQQKQQ